MSRRGKAEWQYKERAILTAAAALRASISTDWLKNATFVPVPPKAKDDPLYDDRLTRALEAINKEKPVDCREMIVQSKSTDAVHESDDRLGPDKIYDLYKLDEKLLKPAPKKIVIRALVARLASSNQIERRNCTRSRFSPSVRPRPKNVA